MLFSLISTSAKVLDRIEIQSVNIPTIQGEIQVLPHHLPVLWVTQPGILRYTSGDASGQYAIGAGIYEIDADGVRVIADMVESSTGIDIQSINAKKSEAQAYMEQARRDGLHGTAEYLAAEQEYLKQTALEQLAQRS